MQNRQKNSPVVSWTFIYYIGRRVQIWEDEQNN